MLSRLVTVLIVIPLAVLLIALSVANRTAVPFSIDPFTVDNPALTINVPLFLLLFAALLIGLLTGGLVVWLGQHKYRKAARSTRREANELQAKIEAAKSEKEKSTLPGGLPALRA